MRVQKGKVISILFSLKIDRDGRIIASRLQKPLEFMVGQQHLILGLDNELLGLQAGDKKRVTITPENAYGYRDEHLVLSLKRSQIPAKIDLHQGTILKRKTKNGKLLKGAVKSFDDQTVVVDFNHPLAGETLNFETEIIAVRDAADGDFARASNEALQ